MRCPVVMKLLITTFVLMIGMCIVCVYWTASLSDDLAKVKAENAGLLKEINEADRLSSEVARTNGTCVQELMFARNSLNYCVREFRDFRMSH